MKLRKIIACAAAAAVMCSTALSASAAMINGDGKLNISDATFLLQRICENDPKNCMYDVNGDAKLTITDVTDVLKAIAAGITNPENPIVKWDNITYGDYVFDVRDGEAIIKRYKGSDTNVTVPKVINNFIVNAVGVSAFEGSDVKSVTVPANIAIRNRAFANCPKLEKLIIEGSACSFDKGAVGGSRPTISFRGYSFPNDKFDVFYQYVTTGDLPAGYTSPADTGSTSGSSGNSGTTKEYDPSQLKEFTDPGKSAAKSRAAQNILVTKESDTNVSGYAIFRGMECYLGCGLSSGYVSSIWAYSVDSYTHSEYEKLRDQIDAELSSVFTRTFTENEATWSYDSTTRKPGVVVIGKSDTYTLRYNDYDGTIYYRHS